MKIIYLPFFLPPSFSPSLSPSFPFFLHLFLLFLPKWDHTTYVTLQLNLITWNNHGHPAKSVEREMFEYLQWSMRWKSRQLFGHFSELLLVFDLGSVSASANGSPCTYSYNSLDQPVLTWWPASCGSPSLLEDALPAAHSTPPLPAASAVHPRAISAPSSWVISFPRDSCIYPQTSLGQWYVDSKCIF